MIYIFNSFTKKKEYISNKHLKIYACGITAYEAIHIGHIRNMIATDVFIRFLKNSGKTVTFVRNITDIDDKIINKANMLNITCKQLTTSVIQDTEKILEKMNILTPDHSPKATEYIPSMINMIQKIINNGQAYIKKDGVYFNIDKNKYGRLKKTDKYLDFVLWKKYKENEPYWISPWGKGRPGWHIECSAMSTDILGNEFDIHIGGKDLLFPHHENEIAQCYSANKCIPAHIWMHIGLININKIKMSKSLNNFLFIKDIISKYHPDIIRWYFLQTHYQKDIEFSFKGLENAKKCIFKVYEKLIDQDFDQKLPINDKFYEYLQNNLNTSQALYIIKNEKDLFCIEKMLQILGFTCKYKECIKGDVNDIDILIDQRNQYRIQKRFDLADKIRDQLTEKGIQIKDTIKDNKPYTTWKKA